MIHPYHRKTHTHQTVFKHDRKLEVRIMKLTKKMKLNKSEFIRHLINEAYEKRRNTTRKNAMANTGSAACRVDSI